MPVLTKRRHRCTGCGKLGHNLKSNRDAADTLHWFHKTCLKDLGDWISCKGKYTSSHPNNKKDKPNG